MTIIKQQDVIDSVADALQYISCYHSTDFIDAMHRAWQMEESASAKNAISQILINSRMAAEGKRPICQDTGIVVAFVKIGMNVQWAGELSLQEMINEGTRRAYLNPDNPLRASVVSPPFGARKNTQDNTPAVVYTQLVAGDGIEIKLAAKGGGSENKTKFTVLNPSDSIVDWVVKTVPKMGAGWCPPGVLGIGIGGSTEKSMLLAKESLMEPIDIQSLIKRGVQDATEALRLEIYHAVNNLGIGAQGLGGLTTVLDVKINTYPTHAVSLPIAMIPNCAATRHIHFNLDGKGAATFTPPNLSNWPVIEQASNEQPSTKVNVDTLTQADIKHWQPGQNLLLSGTILTGRDAAHKRIEQMLEKGKPLPVDFNGKFIYYVGPVDPIKGEAVGPAGPTTATRMDKFTDMMLDKTGIMGMIGKAERGAETIASIKAHESVYLIAVGGAAYLVSKAIKAAKVVGFDDLGMEAIYEFTVKDMPVTVAVDAKGESVHTTGPKKWKGKSIQVDFG